MDEMLSLPCTAVIMPGPGSSVLGTARRYDPNQFGLPGGKVDPPDGPLVGDVTDKDYFEKNEHTLRKGAARELMEETGFVVNPKDLVFITSTICRDELDGKSPTAMTWCFYAPNPGGSPNAPEGEPEAKWVDISDLYKGPFASYNRIAIQAYYNTNPE